MRKAVANITGPIRDILIGMDVTEQRKIDLAMIALDGSPNKRNLGANAILGASLAAARAASNVLGLPLYRYLNPFGRVLPVPLMNCLNGGKLTANNLEIQEFILMPVGAENYSHALQITTEINEQLRELVIAKYGILATNTGDEGGFATPMTGIWEPFEFMQKAVEKAGYKAGFGEDIVYALDCASSHWHDKAAGTYTLEGQIFERDGLIDLSPRSRPNIRWRRSKIRSTRRISTASSRSRRPSTRPRSSATIFSSPASNGCASASSAVPPMRCCSRSTRSARSAKRSIPPNSPIATAMASRSPSVRARPRTR
jgi:hypothetical protein